MPNGQIAGCDAVVKRTAAAYRDRRPRGTIAVDANVVADDTVPAPSMARSDGVPGSRGRQAAPWPRRAMRRRRIRLRRRRDRTQEHRTHAVAARQTGTSTSLYFRNRARGVFEHYHPCSGCRACVRDRLTRPVTNDAGAADT